MGNKINPYAWRLGINQPWKSRYLAPKGKEIEWLKQDELIRNYISFHFPETVSVETERTDTELFVYVYTFNSNLVSGERENDNNNSLKQALVKIINDKKISIKVDFRLDRDSAQALVNDLVQQLQKDPAGWKQICQKTLLQVSQNRENKGVKLEISGRLNGREIAETKKIDNKESISNSSIASLISYGEAEAKTSTGKIGITIQISKKEKQKIKYHVRSQRS